MKSNKIKDLGNCRFS